MSANLLALFLTFVLALIWLRINDFAAHRGWISSHLSRKIIHIGTGPIFVLCWLLFTNNLSARYLAALVPLAITFQFALVGFGVIKDDAAVQAMSRTGDRGEILRGPLYYGIIFVVLTVVFWYDKPTGIVALMMLCGGDGLADILGRRYGKVKLPWNRGKSWAGSGGMFLGGWVFALIVLLIYTEVGIFTRPFNSFILPVTIISVVATIVETLPLKDIDNITITLVAVILGAFLF